VATRHPGGITSTTYAALIHEAEVAAVQSRRPIVAVLARATGDLLPSVDCSPEQGSDGTLLTLRHTNSPEGQSGNEQGWRDNYFDPMRAFFAQP
jgi:hypothetical protein